MSAFGEIIGFILEIVGDVLFEHIMLPILKAIGTSARWVLCLGQTPFKELYKQDHNALIGIFVIIITIISYILSKIY